nr:immediate-early protein [White spot syndrome virus]WRY70754.1 immediate-early protein [White spot syndrome virus]WRY70924.1 immediate-early protein [White spot syndrome virus]BDX28139.1 MAG: immediate-early protein [White spot syndrome virus]BDX28304.1 MAG: immediate-early protein [White spot syndrome virus]
MAGTDIISSSSSGSSSSSKKGGCIVSKKGKTIKGKNIVFKTSIKTSSSSEMMKKHKKRMEIKDMVKKCASCKKVDYSSSTLENDALRASIESTCSALNRFPEIKYGEGEIGDVLSAIRLMAGCLLAKNEKSFYKFFLRGFQFDKNGFMMLSEGMKRIEKMHTKIAKKVFGGCKAAPLKEDREGKIPCQEFHKPSSYKGEYTTPLPPTPAPVKVLPPLLPYKNVKNKPVFVPDLAVGEAKKPCWVHKLFSDDPEERKRLFERHQAGRRDALMEDYGVIPNNDNEAEDTERFVSNALEYQAQMLELLDTANMPPPASTPVRRGRTRIVRDYDASPVPSPYSSPLHTPFDAPNVNLNPGSGRMVDRVRDGRRNTSRRTSAVMARRINQLQHQFLYYSSDSDF